jgi:hypothetical protein
MLLFFLPYYFAGVDDGAGEGELGPDDFASLEGLTDEPDDTPSAFACFL